MSKKRFLASLRTRVTKKTKQGFDKLAEKKNIPAAILHREAFEQYLQREGATPVELENKGVEV